MLPLKDTLLDLPGALPACRRRPQNDSSRFVITRFFLFPDFRSNPSFPANAACLECAHGPYASGLSPIPRFLNLRNSFHWRPRFHSSEMLKLLGACVDSSQTLQTLPSALLFPALSCQWNVFGFWLWANQQSRDSKETGCREGTRSLSAGYERLCTVFPEVSRYALLQQVLRASPLSRKPGVVRVGIRHRT